MIATAADGTRLHYIVEGTGPPLVLVGGRTSTIEGAWWRYIPALSARFTVIALDNRGSGGSGKPDTPYSTSLMAEDALTVLRDAGQTSADWFGLSMGGMILQQLALTHPDAVRSLILGATHCGGERPATAAAPLREPLRRALHHRASRVGAGRRHAFRQDAAPRHRSTGPGGQAAQPLREAGRNPPTGSDHPRAAGPDGAGRPRRGAASPSAECAASGHRPGRPPGPLRAVRHGNAIAAGLRRRRRAPASLSGHPGDELATDLLVQPALDGQRLTMRQRLLQRQALLEHVALHDARKELGSQLTAGLRTAPGETDQRGLARLVVFDDFLDPTAMIEKR